MRKSIILFILVIYTGTAFAQEVSNKALNEVCACVKKIDSKLTEDQQGEQAIMCMTNAMGKYQDGLKKEFNITTNDMQQAMQEIGANMGVKLISACPEVLPYLMKYAQKQQEAMKDATSINPDTLKLDKKVCALYTSGKYKYVETYLNKMSTPISDETAYSEFKEGSLYDYYDNGKYSSKWSVKWINNCEWEQVLMETNEPKLKSVMRKGDKIVLKAIGSSPNGDLWVSSTLLGFDMLVRLRKVK
jgi:hypothetical protein